jgi:hypothetical protein
MNPLVDGTGLSPSLLTVDRLKIQDVNVVEVAVDGVDSASAARCPHGEPDFYAAGSLTVVTDAAAWRSHT